MSKVNWGILGTARIATEKVIPAMQSGKYCQVTAIASRTPGKAQAAAGKLGLNKAYGSYEDLLADPEIDAVYIPLPNHLHVPWSIKALEANKRAVRKPIALF
jgi:predicted dehydrogenase